MKQLKISIVTVCLNSEKTLEKAMESVFSQNYQNLEYIVIDGGSRDGTLDIIHKYEDRLSFWCSSPDRGIYDAMNKGIDHSQGDIIAFLNSDDWYEGGAFNAVLGAFECTKADIVFGDYSYVTENGIIYKNNKYFELSKMKIGRVICHQSMFFRRELFDIYGRFDLKYSIASDYAWTLNAYNHGVCFSYVSENICYFTRGGISTNDKTRHLCMEEIKKIAINAIKKEEEAIYLPLIEEMCSCVSNNMMEATDLAERLVKLGQAECNMKEILSSPKALVLFGSGYYAEVCIRICEVLGLEIVGIVDNDQRKWGSKLHDIVIHNTTFLEDAKGRIILISSILYEKEIAQQLEQMGYIRNIQYYGMVDWEMQLLDKIYGQTNGYRNSGAGNVNYNGEDMF